MLLLRKPIVGFFASLILIFSVTCYLPGDERVNPDRWNSSEELGWVSPAAAPGFLIQEGTSSQGSPVWRSEISIPGLFFRSQSTTEPPRLQLIRKIFVVDTFTYTPCKSVLLYPYHEFS